MHRLGFFFFILFFIPFLLTSCASQHLVVKKTQAKKIQNKRTRQILKNLKQNLQKGKLLLARNAFQYLKDNYPHSDLLQEASLLWGDFYYYRKKYDKALSFYRSVLDAKTFSPSTSPAWVKMVLSAQYANLNSQAEKLSERALRSPYLHPRDRFHLQRFRLYLLTRNKKWFSLLKEYFALFEGKEIYPGRTSSPTHRNQSQSQNQSPSQNLSQGPGQNQSGNQSGNQNRNRSGSRNQNLPRGQNRNLIQQNLKSYKSFYWVKILQIVQQKLSFKELQFLLKDPSFEKLRPVAHLHLARLKMTDKKQDRALKHLNHALTEGLKWERNTSLPAPVQNTFVALRKEAQRLKMDILSLRQVKTKNLGLILPLSGKHTARGQRVLEAVRLGLSLYGEENSPFQLVVRDSEGQADVAEQAVKELVKEHQVIAIIGSLLSRTAPAVAKQAQALRIPCISLSQKMGLAEEGPFVFQHALTSERQVSFLMRELRKQYALRDFALLYPQDGYGEEFAGLFWKGLEGVGGDLRGAQSYAPEQRDFHKHIKKILGLYERQDRLEEYQTRLNQWRAENPRNRKNKDAPEELLPPIIDFQGLFLPDSVEILAQVASMLFYYNVKEVVLVGTNLWNTPQLANSLKGLKGIQVFFVDSFALDRERWKQNPFFRLYKERVQKEPGVLELNAYETAFIFKEIIMRNNINSRYGLLNKLKKMKSFPGILGVLQVSGEGEIYRPLQLFKHVSGG